MERYQQLDPSITMEEWFKTMLLPRSGHDISMALADKGQEGWSQFHYDNSGVLNEIFYNYLLQKVLPSIIEQYLVPCGGIPRIYIEKDRRSYVKPPQSYLTAEMDEAYKRELARRRLKPIYAGLQVIKKNLETQNRELHDRQTREGLYPYTPLLWNLDPIKKASHRWADGYAAIEQIARADGYARDALITRIAKHLQRRLGQPLGFHESGVIFWDVVIAADSTEPLSQQ